MRTFYEEWEMLDSASQPEKIAERIYLFALKNSDNAKDLLRKTIYEFERE